jgi:hypothetical protein
MRAPNQAIAQIRAEPGTHSLLSQYVLPSVRDLVFLIAFWALLIGPLSNRPLADSDIGWHIRTGQQILAIHAIPRTDSFSSTMRGQPWFAWEWLYDALLGVLHNAMGLNGVVWLAALLMATTFSLVFWQLLSRRTGLPIAVPLWLLVLGACSIHIFARPHIVSWLFTVLWFIALERWEQGTAPRWWLPWFFPLSMLLWVNLHGSWPLGLVLLAIYALSAFVPSQRGSDDLARIQSWLRARSLVWTFGASALATIVNPYGLRLHEHIYHYLSDRYLMNRIAEFRSPDFHGWGQRCYAMILVLVLVALAANRGKMRLSHWLIVLLAAWTGVYAVRNVPVSAMLLVLIVGPILWEALTGLAERSGAWDPLRRVAAWMSAFGSRASLNEFRLRGHLWPALSVVAALAICLNGGRLGSQILIHKEFDAEHFPSRALDYLQREGRFNPIFEPDQWGGYFIYRLYPDRLVMIDDRHDLYGSARFREYLVLMQGEPGWKNVLEKWKIRTFVLPADSTLTNLLGQLPQEWATVYQDKTAVVIEKK